MEYLDIGSYKDKYYVYTVPRSRLSDLEDVVIPCLEGKPYFIEFSISGGIYLRNKKN